MLAEREIHVWVARTAIGDSDLHDLARVLDESERARVSRFRFEEDQRRALVGRGTLRLLLSDYLRRRPEDLQFTYGPHGKPALLDASLEFNVSHSGSFVVIAIAAGSPIGVDVECERRKSDMLAIAGRFFSVDEADAVRRASMDEAPAIFYETWTAKESVIKAAGGGLSIDLTSFRVTPVRERFTPVDNRGDDARLEGWYVRSLPSPEDGYHVAVSARGSDWTTVVRPVN